MKHSDLIDRWVEHFNERDVAACVALYAEDATLQVAFAPPVEGRAAIAEMFTAYFAAASLHCLVKHRYEAEGGRVVLEWQDSVGLLGVNIYEVADGLIVGQRNYFDQLSFLRLSGLPMPAA